MAKRNVSFEVTEEMREFIRLRAKMKQQTASGYLRLLVLNDHVEWNRQKDEFWERNSSLLADMEGFHAA